MNDKRSDGELLHTLKTELVHHQHYANVREADVISLLKSRAFTIERVDTRQSEISALVLVVPRSDGDKKS